ncbi:hypothetical protein KR093_009897, partial [Drosophila rubida]
LYIATKSNILAHNTQIKSKAQLMSNEKSYFNRGFESASGLLRKNGSQFKQTKLSLCQRDNKLIFSGFVEEPSKPMRKHELVSMPTIKAAPITPKVEPATALTTTPMSKPGRNLLSLIGRVDFCIKMQRTMPNLNAIWNVYGNLLRIIEGKRGERTLILRNDDKGPILQSIFYDFDGELDSLKSYHFRCILAGCYVHVVGRFSGENRLNTFSVSQVSIADWQLNFTRIEKLTSYILMQNTLQN